MASTIGQYLPKFDGHLVAVEWECLAGFRRAETLATLEDEAVARALKGRELQVADGGLRRLRAPLIGRWIVEQFG